MREPIDRLIAERETVWGASRISFVLTLLPLAYFAFAMLMIFKDKAFFGVLPLLMVGYLVVKYCAYRTSKDPWWMERWLTSLFSPNKTHIVGG